ncbi:hypothetical protein [Acidovorax sp. Root402]|uniref:hypothetical protein n=1 Tax=Acidovorax sp. Root402 TaxID=1736527 RepID=UPI0006F8945D|nr:hypothetical protein [Acidovorax sp. Root402]KQW20210.1 hypothetical protein ASC83_19150 [Acidovorax sp. Root402]
MDIAAFPLIWRWTQPSHAVLPVDVLRALHPLTTAQIEALGLSSNNRFGSTMVQHLATEDEGETGRWLASLQLPGGRVIAVWNKDTALSLPWETFVTYWSNFCYPSSDDVDIFVEGGPLVLRWRHYETFEYDVDAL